MAETITIICPECEKSIKAPESIVGKKIRCKGCGEMFTAKAPKNAKSKPAKAKPKQSADGEEEEGAYGITEEYLGARCPDCTEKMEEGDIICLNCGYSTVTRTKPRPKIVKETTGGDVFLWILPGIICVFVVLSLITMNLVYILLIWPETFGDVWYDFLGGRALKIWGAVISLFIVFFCGKFAVVRLILDNKPPEIEQKWGEDDEDA